MQKIEQEEQRQHGEEHGPELGDDAAQKRARDMINAERQRIGLPPLRER